MPWTPKEFKDKHCKDLTKKESEQASKIANALLEAGMDEGEAIAVGISRSKVTHKPNKRELLKPKKEKKKARKKSEGVKERKESVTYKPRKVEESTEIKKRQEVNPKAGTKEYGDVKFADDKNKKYPIDNEKHIRAAWNYINKEKNAAKYSGEEVKLIKSRIIRAWKKIIDKAGPPSAEEKK